MEDLPESVLRKVLALTTGCRNSRREARVQCAVVRAVCRQWCAVHDGQLTQLDVSERTEEQWVWALTPWFPALTAVNLAKCSTVTDAGVRALGSLTTLTSLGLDGCELVTDDGVRALASTLAGLTSLTLGFFTLGFPSQFCDVVSPSPLVTGNGVQALASLTGLTFLMLWVCELVTDDGMQALSSLTSLTSLTSHGRRWLPHP
eukprot:9481805-Pyramimonas_sp.AAC.1